MGVGQENHPAGIEVFEFLSLAIFINPRSPIAIELKTIIQSTFNNGSVAGVGLTKAIAENVKSATKIYIEKLDKFTTLIPDFEANPGIRTGDRAIM